MPNVSKQVILYHGLTGGGKSGKVLLTCISCTLPAPHKGLERLTVLGERNWYQRYRLARDYADEQAARLKLGETIEEWAYETDYLPGMHPPPKRLRLTGAAWVAHAYTIAADLARSLTHTQGRQWQGTIDNCEQLAAHYRLESEAAQA